MIPIKYTKLGYYDLLVVDAGGFTFGFTYIAESTEEARELFYKKLRNRGIRTRRIKVKSVEYVREAEYGTIKGSVEYQNKVKDKGAK